MSCLGDSEELTDAAKWRWAWKEVYEEIQNDKLVPHLCLVSDQPRPPEHGLLLQVHLQKLGLEPFAEHTLLR